MRKFAKIMRGSALWAVVCFLTQVVLPGPTLCLAQTGINAYLPDYNQLILPQGGYQPAQIIGLTIHPENPLQFDFLVDLGDAALDGNQIRQESRKMIKYFLAALTVPEQNLWVNLSPYEADRIIPEGLDRTELGRDMLAQDYVLKQLAASMMHPENDFGREFWSRVYAQAQEMYGTTDIPVDTFNKIWIVPDTAHVVEVGRQVFIIENRMKVLLEQDLLALEKNGRHPVAGVPAGPDSARALQVNDIGTGVVREVLIPAIEQEVNQGQHFEPLRQIYQAMVLATWFKQSLRQSLLGQVYVDQNKIDGINLDDPAIKDQIYARYLEAFQKGVYNYIKEDLNTYTKQTIPRRYFSGGEQFGNVSQRLKVSSTPIDFDPGLVDMPVISDLQISESPLAKIRTALAAGIKSGTVLRVTVNLAEMGPDVTPAARAALTAGEYDTTVPGPLNKKPSSSPVRRPQTEADAQDIRAQFNGTGQTVIDFIRARMRKDPLVRAVALFQDMVARAAAGQELTNPQQKYLDQMDKTGMTSVMSGDPVAFLTYAGTLTQEEKRAFDKFTGAADQRFEQVFKWRSRRQEQGIDARLAAYNPVARILVTEHMSSIDPGAVNDPFKALDNYQKNISALDRRLARLYAAKRDWLDLSRDEDIGKDLSSTAGAAKFIRKMALLTNGLSGVTNLLLVAGLTPEEFERLNLDAQALFQPRPVEALRAERQKIGNILIQRRLQEQGETDVNFYKAQLLREIAWTVSGDLDAATVQAVDEVIRRIGLTPRDKGVKDLYTELEASLRDIVDRVYELKLKITGPDIPQYRGVYGPVNAMEYLAVAGLEPDLLKIFLEQPGDKKIEDRLRAVLQEVQAEEARLAAEERMDRAQAEQAASAETAVPERKADGIVAQVPADDAHQDLRDNLQELLFETDKWSVADIENGLTAIRARLRKYGTETDAAEIGLDGLTAALDSRMPADLLNEDLSIEGMPFADNMTAMERATVYVALASLAPEEFAQLSAIKTPVKDAGSRLISYLGSLTEEQSRPSPAAETARPPEIPAAGEMKRERPPQMSGNVIVETRGGGLGSFINARPENPVWWELKNIIDASFREPSLLGQSLRLQWYKFEKGRVPEDIVAELQKEFPTFIDAVRDREIPTQVAEGLVFCLRTKQRPAVGLLSVSSRIDP